jgi:adenosylhomocysteine nucleosidase
LLAAWTVKARAVGTRQAGDDAAVSGARVRSIAIVVALAAERAVFASGQVGAVHVHQSGPGPAGALVAARRAVTEGALALVSFGWAGALDPDLAPGAVLVPPRVLTESGAPFATDRRWLDAVRGALTGAGVAFANRDLLSTERVLHTPAAKRLAGAATGAGAVDMEAWTVASVAHQSNLPFAAIKVVLDAACDAVPAGAEDWLDARGHARWWPVLRAASHPARWPATARLARDFWVARKRLGMLADELGRDGFCCPYAERRRA